jgi:hypothetical protein
MCLIRHVCTSQTTNDTPSSPRALAVSSEEEAHDVGDTCVCPVPCHRDSDEECGDVAGHREVAVAYCLQPAGVFWAWACDASLLSIDRRRPRLFVLGVVAEVEW